MRAAAFALAVFVLPAIPAPAQETAASAETNAGLVPVTTTYGLTLSFPSQEPAAYAAVEDRQKRALYARAPKECEALLATIAATCAISSISVSSQIMEYPGQPTSLSVSATVTADISLR